MALTMSTVSGRGGRAGVGVAAACLALLVWGASGGWGGRGEGRAALSSRRAFPHRAPSDIAHRLADFSTLPHALSATPGSWRVEEERGNFSTWRYLVQWECGPRCAGEARVLAEAAAPAAGVRGAAARDHRVTLHLRTCTRAAVLPWSAACDEMEIVAEVEPDGADGAVLRESARATCGAGGGEGGCEATLRAHRARHHAILEGSI